jgi:hypothetical protein
LCKLWIETQLAQVLWVLEAYRWEPSTKLDRPPRHPWEENKDVSKLLGTTFGLSLSTCNIDDFLPDRIHNSLGYWSATKINSTGHGTIVNSILLSSTFYFTSIWGGTKKGVAKVKSVVTNYFWFGSMNRS